MTGPVRLDDETAALVAEELAEGIGYGDYRDRLESVADAIDEVRRPAQIAKLAQTAAAAAWEDGLRGQAAAELDALEADARDRLARYAEARAELSRPVTDNRLATALVAELAGEMVADGVAFALHMEQLEDELQAAAPGERRRIALHAAAEVAVVEIPEGERSAAAASFVAPTTDTSPRELIEQTMRGLARSLATDERRSAAREAVAESFAGASADLPLLATAVDDLLGEPIPEDAGEDDLWVGAVFGPSALEL